MLKPSLLLAASCCALVSYAQKTDTLLLFYKTDQYTISKQDKQKLDSFLVKNWDRISINGHTDETDDEEYNLGLSKKRSGEVYQYFIAKNIPGNSISSQYFGESMPRAGNGSDNGRALNRRTEIIGYQFLKIVVKPPVDPMKPVTKTLDNGFIITYRPGAMPDYLANNFAAGSGMNFQQISNTTQMRENNFYNNTTNGEILSSVMILCPDQVDPCDLDHPVELRVPVPFKTSCSIYKVKFFVTVMENGKKIWQEQNKTVYPEQIGDQTYLRVLVDNFCGCVNFDFKIPECFDTDSTQVQYVNASIKNLSAELVGLNSVYLPRKINDSTHSIMFIKDKLNDALISFSLYDGKRRIRTFRNQALEAFPYDEATKNYVLSTGTQKFYFPGLKIYDVVLKVNNDKYRVYSEKNKYEFIYLNRKAGNILVDFSIIDGKGRLTEYKNQPIHSLPYDEAKGYHVVDKKFIKSLKQTGTIAGM